MYTDKLKRCDKSRLRVLRLRSFAKNSAFSRTISFRDYLWHGVKGITKGKGKIWISKGRDFEFVSSAVLLIEILQSSRNK